MPPPDLQPEPPADVFLASSVEEALAHLAALQGQGQVLGGGTDLAAASRDGAVAEWVDVSRIADLRRVSAQNGYLLCGGALTLAALAEHALVRERAPLLAEAAQQSVGASALQHATLAGLIVAARGNVGAAVALMALDAEAELTNLTGAQWLPVASLYVRPGVSRVDSTCEIVTAVRVQAQNVGQGAALERLAPSSKGAPSPFILALVVALSSDGHALDWASLAVGGEGDVPRRLPEAEQALAELDLDAPALDLTFTRLLISECAGVVDDLAEAQRQQVADLAQRALQRALAAARATLAV